MNVWEIIRVDISPFMSAIAPICASEKRLNRHSIHENQAAGWLGEWAFSKWLDDEWLKSNRRNQR